MAVTVDIEITDDGKVKIEPTGYKDGQCMTDLSDLEDYLEKVGVKTKTTEQKLKAASYVRNTQGTRSHVKQ